MMQRGAKTARSQVVSQTRFQAPVSTAQSISETPLCTAIVPTSQENAQVFFHSQGLAVLCIRNSGFTLTNGVVSYAMDGECPHELFKFLHYLNVGTICVTEQHSKQTFKDIQAIWSSSTPFKRAPVMLLNSTGCELGQCPFCNQTTCHRWIAVQGMCPILHLPINPNFHSRCFTSVHDGPNRCLFRAHFHHRGARDAARGARRIGICRSAGTIPCLHHLSRAQHETSFCLVLQRQLVPKKTLVDNFKRDIMEAKHVNELKTVDVLWEKISKGLLRNADRPLKNTDKRMVYICNNMCFVEKDFTFGFRTAKSGEIHLIQTINVPMVIYEFPSSSLRCRANPNLFRRSF
ncbi:hypothetical protein TNCV_1528491 [Trichonephila clavipes]|nr:hypothetical protein TNCV_1528491 [Trichonephila clavipes]